MEYMNDWQEQYSDMLATPTQALSHLKSGQRVFIGSNSALVAPVKIGADAIVAAGSTVTRDVGDGELRLVRGEQLVKPGWADRFHDAMKKKKAEKKG